MHFFFAQSGGETHFVSEEKVLKNRQAFRITYSDWATRITKSARFSFEQNGDNR